MWKFDDLSNASLYIIWVVLHVGIVGHDSSSNVCQVPGQDREGRGEIKGTIEKVLRHGWWEGSEEDTEQGDSRGREGEEGRVAAYNLHALLGN